MASNCSRVITRSSNVFAAFILVVAFRYYRRKLAAEWAEESDDAATGGGGAQETWQQGQKQGHVDMDIAKQKTVGIRIMLTYHILCPTPQPQNKFFLVSIFSNS